MVNLNCPICKLTSNQNQTLLTIEKNQQVYFIKQCKNCCHIFTFFDHEIDIRVYYDEMDYEVRETKNTIFYWIQYKEYKRVIRQIQKLNKGHNLSLLDFGSGKGLFLNFAKESGLTVKGVETSVPRAKYARENFNVEVSEEEYNEGKIFDKLFNVITLFHVLEHVEEPCMLLRNLIKDNLTLDGLIVIEVPNFESWQCKWAGKRWLHLDVPRHLNHFTPRKLESILKDELHLEVKKQEYFSLHHSIIGMMQTIWSWFGYKGFLMAQLKEDKSFVTLIKVIITVPIAFLLEGLSSGFKRGAILRYYAKRVY